MVVEIEGEIALKEIENEAFVFIFCCSGAQLSKFFFISLKTCYTRDFLKLRKVLFKEVKRHKHHLGSTNLNKRFLYIMKRFNGTMKRSNTIVKRFCIVLSLSLLVLNITSTNTYAFGDIGFYFENVKIGEYTILESPAVSYIIYDPYGGFSYQQISQTISNTVKFEVKSAVGVDKVVEFEGSLSYSQTTSLHTSIKTISDPSLPHGPGVGDVVCFEILKLVGDLYGDIIYYSSTGIVEVTRVEKYEITEVINVGNGFMTRQQFLSYFGVLTGTLNPLLGNLQSYSIASNIELEDKTGTSAPYNRQIIVGQGLEYEQIFTVTFTEGKSLSFKYSIPLGSTWSAKVECKATFLSASSFQTKLFLYDTTQNLNFFIRSNGHISTDSIEDLIYWFS